MICRICGGIVEEIHDIQFSNKYYYCRTCEYIGVDKKDVVTKEKEKAQYDYHENTIEQEGYVEFFKKFINNAVIPFLIGDVGLDFGSGPEPVLAQVMLRDYNRHIDFYDLYYQPEKIYENKIYDYIISTEVMEHLQDPMKIIRILYKHLKVGGTLSIMTLFHENNTEQFLKWWYRRDVTHISFFTPQTFKVISKKTGFEIIYTDNKRYITLKKVSR